MKVDSTIARILLTIQKEVEDKYGKFYTVEQLHKVITTQFEATKLGIQKGLVVHWVRFGRFVCTNKTKTKLEIIKLDKTLARAVEDGDLLPHQILEIRKERIIELAEVKRATVTKADIRLTKGLPASTVLGIEKEKTLITFNVIK